MLRLRVSHAQRLLLTSELPVEQVARESGFSSSTSFYRTFRRLCGCTPRAYRVR
ncbi:MAG: helix-turn-helix domain-containing protein [Actinomycetota bacterium]|nr:helix-turn-helix domain-containing protein [Actinomycetota bacterium]